MAKKIFYDDDARQRRCRFADRETGVRAALEQGDTQAQPTRDHGEQRPAETRSDDRQVSVERRSHTRWAQECAGSGSTGAAAPRVTGSNDT